MDMQPVEATQGPIPLETISEQGKAPKARVKDAQTARDICTTVWDAADDRRLFDSKLKGMVDGNPPYDPTKLKAAGLSGLQININSGEAKAILSSALVPDYDIFAGSRHYAQVRTAKGDVNQKEEWSGVLTEEFDRTLKEWDGFDFNVQSTLYDRKLYGKGMVLFRDPVDWRFSHVCQSKVAVPDSTECVLENVDCVVVRESFRAHYLWSKVKDGSENGWNKDEVIEQIRRAQPDMENENPQEVQRQLRDHDLYWGVKPGTVKAYRLYVREFSGRVSLYVVGIEPAKAADKQRSPDRFLYSREGLFANLGEAMWATFFETMDGSWNGAAGLGKDIFPHAQAGDRMLCAVYTNAMMQSSIVVQPNTAGDVQKLQAIKMGVVTVIPPGLTVQNSTLFANVAGPMQVREYASSLVDRNTGVYRVPPDRKSGNPPTASEVILRRQDATTITNAAVNRLYADLDKLYTEVYRRMTLPSLTDGTEGERAAKEFVKRCKERGVPTEAIRNVEWVRSYRNMGNGSLLLRQQSLAGLMPFVPMLPPGGRTRFVEDVVSVFTNQSMVQRYLPKAEVAGQPTDQEAFALLENTSLEAGNPVAITDTQNNEVHAKVHMAAVAQAVTQAMETGDLVSGIRTAEAIMPHALAHIQAYGDADKGVAKELMETAKEIGGAVDQLKKAYQKQQEQAQQDQQMMAQFQQVQQGQDPETMLKQAELENKLAMQWQKTNQAMAQKQAKHDQSMVLADAKTAQGIRLQQRKAAASESGGESSGESSSIKRFKIVRRR